MLRLIRKSVIPASEVVVSQLRKYGYELKDESLTKRFEPPEYPILEEELIKSLKELNPEAPYHILEMMQLRIINLMNHNNYREANRKFRQLLVAERHTTTPSDVDYETAVKLINYAEPQENRLHVRIHSAIGNLGMTSICAYDDFTLYINGLPVALIRLSKDLTDECLTSFIELYEQQHKSAVYHCFRTITDGSRIFIVNKNSLKRKLKRWRTEEPGLSLFNPPILIDFITNFISFNRGHYRSQGSTKLPLLVDKRYNILGNYHQYYGVNKLLAAEAAVASKATAARTEPEDLILYHTFGSQLPMTMLFYIAKYLKQNPTKQLIIVLPDLADEIEMSQLCRQHFDLLRYQPVCAKNNLELRELTESEEERIIISTVHKFYSGNAGMSKIISRDKNIAVIIKELETAHYGFIQQVRKNKSTSPLDNFRKLFLPNATVVCFTRNPMYFKQQGYNKLPYKCTHEYSMQEALQDQIIGQAVYYERSCGGEKLHQELDKYILAPAAANAKIVDVSAPNANLWKKLEELLGDKQRVQTIAKNTIEYFEMRRHSVQGNAVFVAASRRIAVQIFEEIIRLRPDWYSPKQNAGLIKLIISSDIADPKSWDKYKTTQEERRKLMVRFQNPKHEFQLAIIVNMWSALKQANYVHTIYWDKPMQPGELLHKLMHATLYPNGLGQIVDYLGMEHLLRLELQKYISKQAKDMPIITIKQGTAAMKEQYEKVRSLFVGFDYSNYHQTQPKNRLEILFAAREFVLANGVPLGDLMRRIDKLSSLYNAVSSTPEAAALKPELAFMQTLRESLFNLSFLAPVRSVKEHYMYAQREIVLQDYLLLYGFPSKKKLRDNSKKQQVLANILGLEATMTKQLALACFVHKMVHDLNQSNLSLGRTTYAELLGIFDKQEATKDYDIIPDLVKIARKILQHENFKESLSLHEEAYSIYVILEESQAAGSEMPKQKLVALANEVFNVIREKAKADWYLMQTARAQIRLKIKYSLREHGYAAQDEKELANKLLEYKHRYESGES